MPVKSARTYLYRRENAACHNMFELYGMRLWQQDGGNKQCEGRPDKRESIASRPHSPTGLRSQTRHVRGK